ncbi:MAG: hypothetical protein FJ291_04535 [Planctomycetes bacterium]|nr:hypothetical protein [Planctomycetota bacterium]
MATSVSVEAMGPELRQLIELLPEGETVEILGDAGEQVALLLTVKQGSEMPLSPDEWLAELDALAEEIGRAWKSEKSAVELVSEMRR